MASRTTFSGSSTPPVSGADLLTEYAARIDTLFDASSLPLTAVGGTGDAVTATLDPALATADTFVDGMKFTITWGAANTGGVTLAINGGSARPVVDSAGGALIADALEAGLRSQIEYIGGSFRILGGLGGSAGGQMTFFQVFTASGTWNKPAGFDEGAFLTVEVFGAGGSGRRDNVDAGGGGGGGYASAVFRLADLPASVAVTIGAGGVARTSNQNGAAGGASSFGTFLGVSGGGGGTTSAGGSGGTLNAFDKTRGRRLFASAGGPGASPANNGGATFGPSGGGGGTTSGTSGGSSTIGGDGGGGGDGSPAAGAGQEPGGGGGGGIQGGNSGAGARGEVRIWIG